MIQFEIPGKVQAKQRHRMTRSGHSYTPKETVEYENWIKLCFQQSECKMLDGQLSATVMAFFDVPKSTSKKNMALMLKGELLPIKRPDCDNIAKSVLDALNGLAYKDDSQIVKLTVIKEYAEKPSVFVRIEEI